MKRDSKTIMLDCNSRTFVLVSFVCVAILSLGLIFFAPQTALAEEKSGIEVILPNMIEFIPLLIAFIVVAIVLGKFGWPAFEKMIEVRDNKIKQNIQDSEDLKFKARQQLNQYKDKLAEADAEANNIVSQAKDEGAQTRQKIEREAQDKAAEILKSAQNTIEIDKRKAEHEIQAEVVNVAMMVTQKVISQDLTKEEHRKLIEKYVTEAGSIAGE